MDLGGRRWSGCGRSEIRLRLGFVRPMGVDSQIYSPLYIYYFTHVVVNQESTCLRAVRGFSQLPKFGRGIRVDHRGV